MSQPVPQFITAQTTARPNKRQRNPTSKAACAFGGDDHAVPSELLLHAPSDSPMQNFGGPYAQPGSGGYGNTVLPININGSGNSGSIGYTSTGGLIINNGLIMTQPLAQQQQPPQQQLAFPQLPAPVSSASSLGSGCNSSSSGNSPMPVQNPALQNASLPQVPSVGPQTALQTTLTSQLTSQQVAPTAPALGGGGALLTFAPNLASNPTLAPVPAQASGSNTLSMPYQVAASGPAALLPASCLAAATAGGSVPEFLYQLTKMLTDPNRDIIEWTTYSGSGRIEVHHPGRLEKEVLGRYFRHSKYSSFQRQLNYFGFRKIAGKGKMSPCSYVNEAATCDIRSILLMKRKNSKEKEKELAERRQREEAAGSGKGSKGKKRATPGDDMQPATVRPLFNPSSASVVTNGTASVTSSKSGSSKRSKQSQSKDGRAYTVAVGKGVRHQLNGYLRPNASATATTNTATTNTAATAAANQGYLARVAAPAPLQFLDPSELGMSLESSLSQLKDNFAAAAATRRDSLGATSSGAVAAAPANAAVGAAASALASMGSPANPAATANGAGGGENPAPSALTRRISSMTFPSGGMLSRDDSLINLAMLPTLDAAATAGSEGNGAADGGLAAVASGIFSRNNSLMNLAAAVEVLDDGTARPAGNGGGGGEDGGDAFGFFDS